MSKFIFIVLIYFLVFISPSFAKEKIPTPGKNKISNHSKHRHSAKEKHKHGAKIMSATNERVTIKVNGMVCAFCAQGIEKNMNKRDAVKSTKVDLDEMSVEILFKKGKSLNQETIKKIITDAGFKFIGVE